MVPAVGAPAPEWTRVQKKAAGRERVVTRGRGICRPTVLLPPLETPSYHNKVTNVSIWSPSALFLAPCSRTNFGSLDPAHGTTLLRLRASRFRGRPCASSRRTRDREESAVDLCLPSRRSSPQRRSLRTARQARDTTSPPESRGGRPRVPERRAYRYTLLRSSRGACYRLPSAPVDYYSTVTLPGMLGEQW